MKKNGLIGLAALLLGCAASLFAGGSGDSKSGGAAAADGTWKPTHDVEFMVASGVGGGSDLWMREIANIILTNKLSDVNFMTINKPGGASAPGYNYFYSKKGDPYSILSMHSGGYTSSYIAGWDRTFDQLMQTLDILAFDDVFLCTHSTGPYKDIKSLIAAAKANPGKIRFGSDQRLNSSHYAFEMIKKFIGADMSYVQFDSSGEAATALLGDHVDVAILNPSECIGQVEAGNFLPVVTFATDRLAGKFANTPTFKELGYPDIVLREFRGICVTLDCPPAAKKYYEDLMITVKETPQFKAYLEKNYLTPTYMGPDEAQQYAISEMKKVKALFDEVTKK